MAKENKEKRVPKNTPKLRVELSEEQKEVVKLFHDYDVIFVHGDFGCFEKDTRVRMYDGTVKNIQDIVVGDKLMGMDSTPRTVLRLNRGRDMMYKISQKKGGLPYVVNSKHILALSKYYKPTYFREYVNDVRVTDYSKIITPSRRENVDITVENFLKIPFGEVNHQGYISEPIKYPEKQLLIEPYYLGLWLGDGSRSDIKQITNTDTEIIKYLHSLSENVHVKDNITYIVKELDLNDRFKKLYDLTNINRLSEKYIPTEYLINSIENRKQLLAGIIDSDGSLMGFSYEIIQKNKRLSYEIYNLIRSLGYNAYIRTKVATMNRNDGTVYECPVYRITFSVTEDNTIPCKVTRKIIKDFNRVDGRNPKYNGLVIKELYEDEYFGFTVDVDNKFILEDYTVVHNCGKTLAAVHTALTYFNRRQCNEIWLTRPMLKNQLAALPGSLEEKLAPYTFPLQQNLEVCQGKETTDKLMREGVIKIMPIEVAKGCSFMDSVVIVDEYQDMDYQDFRTILTRLNSGSKMIFCGSKEQIDKQIGEKSCIYKTMSLEKSELVGYITLKSNHRNPILTDIINFLEK